MGTTALRRRSRLNLDDLWEVESPTVRATGSGDKFWGHFRPSKWRPSTARRQSEGLSLESEDVVSTGVAVHPRRMNVSGSPAKLRWGSVSSDRPG